MNSGVLRLDQVITKLLTWNKHRLQTKNCYDEDVLKKDVLERKKMLTGISVSNQGLLTNLNQYLRNLYLTNL